MDIGQKIVAMEKQIAELQRAARLSSASLDDTALLVRDGTGSLRAVMGQQSDGTTAVNVVNGPPPPQPSAPIVASVLGGVTASWDGSFTGGQVLPLDWSRTEVHASTATGFTPDASTLRSTIETAQGGTVVIPTDTPVYVRLAARNTSGAPSAPSAQTGPYGPAPVVSTDILDGIVTTVKLADDAVTAAKVAAAAVTPEALSAVLADTVSQRWVDTMDDPTAWTTTLGTGASWSLIPAPDAPSGGTVGQAAGYVWARGTTLIPHDPSTLYRVSVRIRTTAQPAAGIDTIYLGVAGFAADKTTLVNRTGANSVNNHYYVTANNTSLPAVDGWQVFTGFIQGRAAAGVSVPGTAANDPLAPAQFHDQVRYIAPYLWFNFTNRDPAGIMQVDMVSVEALRTGVVTAAYLAAGSVSTSKLVAGAVQTAQLDAEAVNASKLAAGAVTTAKLDALAVTADKIAANAIIVGKLDAGSVDATALKADAITGKTITGGVINGAEFHSDDGAGGLVDIESGTVETTAATGWKIVIDPTQALPVLDFLSDTGITAGSINAMGNSSSTGLVMSSGPFTDGAVTDWRWATRSGADGGSNGWRTGRFRGSDTTVFAGGYSELGPTKALLAVVDSSSPSTNTIFQINPGIFICDEGRLFVSPPLSSSPAIYINAKVGHAGTLFRAQIGSADRFIVTTSGAVTATGAVTAASASLTGALNAASATVTGAVNAGSATVTGALGAGSATVTGRVTAGNIRSGRVTFAPTAANTPTSTTVTGLAMTGTDPRAVATASTTVPGTQMLGIGCTNVTLDTVTIWLTRTNTSSTGIDYIVIAS